jgi:serine/threonine protein kinase
VSTFESCCPNCRGTFKATDHQVGRLHRCDKCGRECIVPSQRVDPGAKFGDFTVLYPLGVGASGEVHLAKDSQGRRSALKILFQEELGDEVDLRRFLRESQFIRSLSHPSLIQVYDVGLANNLHYIAMEFVEGETLDHHLDKFGELAETDGLRIARDVAAVMSYVWNTGKMVHRDLKPANLMVAYDGTTKVMDLGIAKSYLYDLTQLTDPETILGSPPYMSPEQCAPGKRLDFRADIYSLGCTLYQLVTNEYAFFADTPMSTVRMQLFDKHTDPREHVPGLSEGLARLIERMLAKSASQRHESWEQLLAEIEALL